MKTLLNKFFGVSGGHKIISRTVAEQLQLDQQWQDSELPQKQLEIVKRELAHIKSTHQFPAHMQALIDQVKLLTPTKPSVLEIGCSSGYYNEILQLAGVDMYYTGCDYSPAFINLAKQLYPNLPFDVCDATALPYQDQQFDVAISGCCILHILDYPKAIQETARVTKRYALFSRTPVVHLAGTTYTKKMGYGVPMIEIIFNETELLRHFHAAGLRVIDIITFGKGPHLPGIKEPTFSKTYLCEKLP
ncbi:MAG: methyltransferase type 11 [uncultured bacterium]|nr:MAG: methyltransferase type 11 [uncultured bacterium]HBY73569.1 class I SAM-dependent methyltransferase [Candidatus Kerfeldbacteria bacterium]